MNPIETASGEPRESESKTDAAGDLARETLYRILSAALSEPRSSNWAPALSPKNLELACYAADLLREEFADAQIPLGFGELPLEDLDVRPLVKELAKGFEEIQGEYTKVFGLVTCRECPPYETEYHKNEDTFFRAQQMADIAGFFQAFGLQASSESRERTDYLPLELEFQAFLLMKKRLAPETGPAGDEERDICQQARAAFFRDHLSWWVPSFTLALRRKTETGFYPAVARLLAALIPLERKTLGAPAGQLPILQPTVSEPMTNECEECSLNTGGGSV